MLKPTDVAESVLLFCSVRGIRRCPFDRAFRRLDVPDGDIRSLPLAQGSAAPARWAGSRSVPGMAASRTSDAHTSSAARSASARVPTLSIT